MTSELKVVSSEPVNIEEEKEVEGKVGAEVAQPKEETEAEPKEETEQAPAQPPRPVSPLTRVTNDLKEAFPDAEDKIITAVLIASQGQPDPAFNALLYLSDPSVRPEIPVHTSAQATATRTTVPDDEALARKLQKKFELEEKQRRARRRQRRQQQQEEEESPDEFEQLKETFTQGLEEARTTLNGWVSGLAKKFEGNEENPSRPEKKLFGALGGSSFGNNQKMTRFDEDPKIINQYEFNSKISLKDEDKDLPQLPQRKDRKWQPLGSDVPANSDAFLVTDSEDEHK